MCRIGVAVLVAGVSCHYFGERCGLQMGVE